MKETILLVPEYSHEIRGSILQVTQSLLKYVATRDDIHLVVPYPAEGSRWKNWTPEKWGVSSANIEFVPVLMDKFSECALGRVSSDWANSKFGGRKDYSVVATMRSTAPVGIRRLFAKPMVGFYPEVVNMYLIGGIDYFATLAKDLPDEMLFNFLHSWNVLYGTSGFASTMYKRMTELFTPAVCRKVNARTMHMPLGVTLDRLDAVKPMAKPEGQIRLAYGGRLVEEKGVQDYLSISEQLYATGYNVEAGFYFVFDRWGAVDDKIAPYKRPFTRVEVNATPVEEHFFAYAASADMFLCTSKHEAAGLAFQELLALGVPGLFLDAPWVRGLVPDDYPFIYKSKNDLSEAARMFCNRLQNEESLPYDMEKVKKFIRNEHSRSLCERRTVDLLVNLSRAKREKVKVEKICNLVTM